MNKKAEEEYREGDIVETLRNIPGRTMDDYAFKGDQFTVEFEVPQLNAISARPIPYSFMPAVVLKKWDIKKVGQIKKERYLNTFSDQELWDAKQVMEEIGEEYGSPEIYQDILDEIDQRFEEA